MAPGDAGPDECRDQCQQRIGTLAERASRRVQAECEQGAAAVMGKARGKPYVHDVTIFGNALHLLVDADLDDEAIARDLTAAAGSPVHVRPITPSLEDVFVRLTRLQVEGNGGEHAAAAGGAR